MAAEEAKGSPLHPLDLLRSQGLDRRLCHLFVTTYHGASAA